MKLQDLSYVLQNIAHTLAMGSFLLWKTLNSEVQLSHMQNPVWVTVTNMGGRKVPKQIGYINQES